jgi:hypothetical protein
MLWSSYEVLPEVGKYQSEEIVVIFFSTHYVLIIGGCETSGGVEVRYL